MSEIEIPKPIEYFRVLTNDEQMKRLSKLGWTCKLAPPSMGWYWNGPDGQSIKCVGSSIDPAPIPAELLALLVPDAPKQAHTPGII